MQNWTTTSRPSREQYSYWREVICEAFTALDPVAEAVNTFESYVEQKDFSDVTISTVKSRAQTIVRGLPEIKRTPSEFYFANLQLSGTCVVTQDRRVARIKPGDFYIVDTTRPYALDFDEWEIVCIRIPKHMLLPLLRNPGQSTAIRLHSDGALGTIASEYIQSINRCSDSIDSGAKQVLISNLLQLLALALGGTAETKENSRTAVRQGMRDAITRYIDNNLASPNLCVSDVAARFRISTRYLHKLFEDVDQSFAQTILEKRLLRCAHDLSFRTGRSSVSDVAFRWGFGDLSHFCRMFKRRFGITASDYRACREARD